MMDTDAKASIRDGNTLAFNTALVVELAALAKGPELGREKARQFAAMRDADADFEPYLKKLAVHVESGGDRLARALQIVRLIGNAAGTEMDQRDYDGEWDTLVHEFRNGLVSGQSPRESADGTLDDLFSECGKLAADIISAALPDSFEDGVSKEDVTKLAGLVTDVFADGMEGALI
ncbi:MAG: hypothetical protein LBS45_00740 [Synergistaceae bacterium]|jgi:hypothetical protein|nr:hypothetical protein [Synergistaceae bacterium]